MKEYKNCCDKELEDLQSVNEHIQSNRGSEYEIQKGDQDAGVATKSDDGSTSNVKRDNSGIEIHKGTDIVDIHDESNCHPTSNLKECNNISEGIMNGNQILFRVIVIQRVTIVHTLKQIMRLRRSTISWKKRRMMTFGKVIFHKNLL